MGIKLSKSIRKRRNSIFRSDNDNNYSNHQSSVSSQSNTSTNSSVDDEKQVLNITSDQSISSLSKSNSTLANKKKTVIFRNLELINALHFDIYSLDIEIDDIIENISTTANHNNVLSLFEEQQEKQLQQQEEQQQEQQEEQQEQQQDQHQQDTDKEKEDKQISQEEINITTTTATSIVSTTIDTKNICNNYNSNSLFSIKLPYISVELLYNILSFLPIRDILALQSVSKFWYMLIKDELLWKYLIKRDIDNKWCFARNLIGKYEIQHNVNWKKMYCDLWRTRVCNKCSKSYRQCFNSISICKVHTGIRDIVENRGVPSGVYWICCLAKPKDAPGCSTSVHTEEREVSNTSYFN